jgi:hypothetical protein
MEQAVRHQFPNHIVWLMLIGFLAIVVSGCAVATPPPVREVTVTKEVPVPYAAPCPKPEDQPVLPSRVSDDRPVMPTDPKTGLPDYKAIAAILSEKVIDLFSYGHQADAVMSACSHPRQHP